MWIVRLFVFISLTIVSLNIQKRMHFTMTIHGSSFSNVIFFCLLNKSTVKCFNYKDAVTLMAFGVFIFHSHM